MKPIEIALVKPHPPDEVMDRQCPIPDPYRYDWMPMALKVMGETLIKHFGDQVRVKIYHLMNDKDELSLFDDLQRDTPDMVGFSEIDLLVNEVSRIAQRVKGVSQDALTLCGGKANITAQDRRCFSIQRD